MAKIVTTVQRLDGNGRIITSFIGGSVTKKTLWDAIYEVEQIERNSVEPLFDIVTSIFDTQKILTYIVPYESGAKDIVSYLIV